MTPATHRSRASKTPARHVWHAAVGLVLCLAALVAALHSRPARAACNTPAGEKCYLNSVTMTSPEQVCVNKDVTVTASPDTDCPPDMFEISWSGDLGTNTTPGEVWSFTTSYTNPSTNTVTISVKGRDWTDEPGCFAETSIEIEIYEPCQPGSTINVTLTEGEPPWHQPLHAWSQYIPLANVPSIQSMWHNLFSNALGANFPVPEFPFGPYVWASLSKNFIDKCCLDCEDDGCFLFGKYRYKSTRVNLNTPQTLEPPWATNPAFEQFTDLAEKAIEAYELLNPDCPYAEAISVLLNLAQGIELPVQLLINEWVTNEIDECNDCPDVCAGGTADAVIDCETGLRRYTVNLPSFKRSAHGFSFEVMLRGLYEWKGSRVGLQNHKDVRYWGEGEAIFTVPLGIPVGTFPFQIGPFTLDRETTELCM